eukprot:CAMPEP_0178988630 /NCGR_PEP_ID=MMETSP0795-20121207/3910_1 /TAXON_ID=88552 /ORGANISM="Amoebophrya sp., Strain Ameob2" /LENGTH=1044 /DNA_ID=CAMNT_0020679911 /DNA_START=169 /DNA_END=3304 /DNA_ORIENTATION=-
MRVAGRGCRTARPTSMLVPSLYVAFSTVLTSPSGLISALASAVPMAARATGAEVDAEALLKILEKDIEAIDQKKEDLRNGKDVSYSTTKASMDTSVDTSTSRPIVSPTLELGTLGPTLGDFADFDDSSFVAAANGTAQETVLEEEKIATMTEAQAILRGVLQSAAYGDAQAASGRMACRDHVVRTFHSYVLQKFQFSKMRFLRQGFAHFDTNQDGVVSEVEFARFLQARKVAPHCAKPKLVFDYIQREHRSWERFQYEYVEAVETYLHRELHLAYVVPFVDLALFVYDAARYWSLVFANLAEAKALDLYEKGLVLADEGLVFAEEQSRRFARSLFEDDSYHLKVLLREVSGGKKDAADRFVAWVREHAGVDLKSEKYFNELEVRQREKAAAEKERLRLEKQAEVDAKEKERMLRIEKEEKERARAAACESSFVIGENGTIEANPCFDFELPSDAGAHDAQSSMNSTVADATLEEGGAAADVDGDQTAFLPTSSNGTSSSLDEVDRIVYSATAVGEEADSGIDVHPKRAAGFLDSDFEKFVQEPSAADGISQTDWFIFLLTEPYSLRALFFTTTVDKVLVYTSILDPKPALSQLPRRQRGSVLSLFATENFHFQEQSDARRYQPVAAARVRRARGAEPADVDGLVAGEGAPQTEQWLEKSNTFKFIMLTLVFLSTVTFCLETLPEWESKYEQVWRVCELFFVSVFTFEYLLRLGVTSKPYKEFLLEPLNVCDVLSVVPTWLILVWDVPLHDQRWWRIFRLFWVFKFGRHSTEMNYIVKGMAQATTSFVLLVSFLVLALIFFSYLMWVAERGEWDDLKSSDEPHYSGCSPFENVPTAIYWAITAITTVGYGDTYPITPGGKLVTAGCMVMGILCVACPVTVLGVEFSTLFSFEKAEARRRVARGAMVRLGKDELQLVDMLKRLAKTRGSMENELLVTRYLLENMVGAAAASSSSASSSPGSSKEKSGAAPAAAGAGAATDGNWGTVAPGRLDSASKEKTASAMKTALHAVQLLTTTAQSSMDEYEDFVCRNVKEHEAVLRVAVDRG